MGRKAQIATTRKTRFSYAHYTGSFFLIVLQTLFFLFLCSRTSCGSIDFSLYITNSIRLSYVATMLQKLQYKQYILCMTRVQLHAKRILFLARPRKYSHSRLRSPHLLNKAPNLGLRPPLQYGFRNGRRRRRHETSSTGQGRHTKCSHCCIHRIVAFSPCPLGGLLLVGRN